MLPSRFKLGKWGLAVNLFSLAFLSVVFVMVCIHREPHPSMVAEYLLIIPGFLPACTKAIAADDELVISGILLGRHLGHRILLCLGPFQIRWTCRVCEKTGLVPMNARPPSIRTHQGFDATSLGLAFLHRGQIPVVFLYRAKSLVEHLCGFVDETLPPPIFLDRVRSMHGLWQDATSLSTLTIPPTKLGRCTPSICRPSEFLPPHHARCCVAISGHVQARRASKDDKVRRLHHLEQLRCQSWLSRR